MMQKSMDVINMFFGKFNASKNKLGYFEISKIITNPFFYFLRKQLCSIMFHLPKGGYTTFHLTTHLENIKMGQLKFFIFYYALAYSS